MNPQDVLNFWFAPEQEPLWFKKSDDFDAKFIANLPKFTIKPHRQSYGHGVRMPKAVLRKLLYWINFPEIYIGIKHRLLPMTQWRWHWRRKPLVCNWMQN
jgi:uncharacterized protein (DUF924 family)